MAPRLAVLVSGKGTLLEAMLASGLNVHVVLADRRCRGTDIVAANAGITPIVMERSFPLDSAERVRYTQNVADVLVRRGIGLIAMAGFMTIFSPEIFLPFRDRILNSHPSLLPKFKGDHAVRDALASGDKVTGCTIHIATEELDAGPILAQQSVEIRNDDTEETLHERIKAVERVLYPQVIRSHAFRLLEKPRPAHA